MLGGCQLLAGLEGERELGQSNGTGAHGGGGAGDGDGGNGLGGEAELPLAGSDHVTPADAGAAGHDGGGGAGSGGKGTHSGGTGESGEGGDAGDAVHGAGEGGRAGRGGRAGSSGSTGVSGFSGASGGGGAIEDRDGAELDTASCAGGLPRCAGANPCLTLVVPGGSFDMGRSETAAASDYFPLGDPSEVPAHLVTVSPYRLDKYEVTVARFRRFVRAYDGTPPGDDAGRHPNVPDSGWQPEWNDYLPRDQASLLEALDVDDVLRTWSESEGVLDCRPINDVSWYVALAFCIWDGGRLPSEAEWEFAAAGGDEERFFPWGDAAPNARRAAYSCTFSGSSTCSTDDLPDVGSTRPGGVGRFGQSDLAGSLREFVRDQWDENWYGLPQARGTDIINLSFDISAPDAPVRGGNFQSAGDMLRGATRVAEHRRSATRFSGFRCARDP